jgi:hypothetical protein
MWGWYPPMVFLIVQEYEPGFIVGALLHPCAHIAGTGFGHSVHQVKNLAAGLTGVFSDVLIPARSEGVKPNLPPILTMVAMLSCMTGDTEREPYS